MGKYPVNLTDKENSNFKYPFLSSQHYSEINVLPDGPVVLIRISKNYKFSKADVMHMAEINRVIASRREIKENDKNLSGRLR